VGNRSEGTEGDTTDVYLHWRVWRV